MALELHPTSKAGIRVYPSGSHRIANILGKELEDILCKAFPIVFYAFPNVHANQRLSGLLLHVNYL
jgi:hypothetical protein